MDMTNVLGLILGGGQGNRLSPLTKECAKLAVPLAGKYRLRDIPEAVLTRRLLRLATAADLANLQPRWAW